MGENLKWFGISYMHFNVDSSKLFDGLASLVAKAVEKENVRIVRLNSNEPQSCTCAGNAAVKTEEAMFEIDVAGWLMERFAQNDAQQLLENYKASLRKEGDRTAVYKQKWEDTEAILEKERQDREDERQSWEEEKKRMKDAWEEEKKQIWIKAQLDYAEKHPQTIVQGDQINNNTTKVHSETKIKEMKVEKGGTGVAEAPTQMPSCCQEMDKRDKEDIGICRFIERDKIINNTRYGKTDEERIDQYNRIIYRASQKKLSTFVKYLKDENEKGNLKFDTQDLQEIYDHLVECYGDLHGGFRSFKDACHGVTDGRRTDFYWNPK